MAYEFKKLGDVEIAEAISESANVLIEEEGNIKRVSKNNVVPNNVALKSDIPDAVINPSSAVVGQTIVVKAVDENGKPTEWECTDMSSGGDSLTVVYYSTDLLYKTATFTEAYTKDELMALGGKFIIAFLDYDGTSIVYSAPLHMVARAAWATVWFYKADSNAALDFALGKTIEFDS